jgi:hypothetical protein
VVTVSGWSGAEHPQLVGLQLLERGGGPGWVPGLAHSPRPGKPPGSWPARPPPRCHGYGQTRYRSNATDDAHDHTNLHAPTTPAADSRASARRRATTRPPPPRPRRRLPPRRVTSPAVDSDRRHHSRCHHHLTTHHFADHLPRLHGNVATEAAPTTPLIQPARPGSRQCTVALAWAPLPDRCGATCGANYRYPMTLETAEP